MLNQIRQGDILLEVADVQAPAEIRPSTRIVLAEGEATGHTHVVEAESILEWSVGEQRYIRVIGTHAGAISHPQHDATPAFVLAPNVTYKVIRQKTLNLVDEWQTVQD